MSTNPYSAPTDATTTAHAAPKSTEPHYPEFKDASWSEVPIPDSELRSNKRVTLFVVAYSILSLMQMVRTTYQQQLTFESLSSPYIIGKAIGFILMIVLMILADRFRNRTVKLVLTLDSKQIDRAPIAIGFTTTILVLGVVIASIFITVGYVAQELLGLFIGAVWLLLAVWGASRVFDRRRKF